MASAQATGKLNFYRKTPTGDLVFLYGNDVKALGPSGSPDAVIGSTPEKWIIIPMQNSPAKVLRVNDQLVSTFLALANVTLDASDAAWVLPITYQDGSSTTINGPSDAVDWDAKVAADEAYVAGRETILCIKTVRQPFALGSNFMKAFASVENNA